MNPNASVKSLNSNMRCRFPFTTLQPSSLYNPAAISCFDNFPLPALLSVIFNLIHLSSGTIDSLSNSIVLYQFSCVRNASQFCIGEQPAHTAAQNRMRLSGTSQSFRTSGLGYCLSSARSSSPAQEVNDQNHQSHNQQYVDQASTD